MSSYRASALHMEDQQWISQLTEINSRISKAEKQIKEQKMRELQDAYSRKLLEEQSASDAARRRKEEEMSEVARRRQAYDEERAKHANDELQRKNELASLYKAKMEEKKTLEQEKKLREMDDANRRIEMQKRAMELQKKMEKDKLDAFNRAAAEDVARREEEKRQRKDNDFRAREEYRGMMALNAEKEVKKEENYRNYFKRCSEVQEKLQSIHTEKVLASSMERNRNLDEFVRKNEEDYIRKGAEEESAKLRRRQEDLTQANQVVLDQIRRKEESRMLNKMGSADALRSSNDPSSMDQLEKMLKRDGQKVYKDILDKQREGKNLQLHKSQTMIPTQGMYLIPGFSNSKYIHPYSPEARYANILDFKVNSDKVASVATPSDASPSRPPDNSKGSPNNGSYLASFANNNLIR